MPPVEFRTERYQQLYNDLRNCWRRVAHDDRAVVRTSDTSDSFLAGHISDVNKSVVERSEDAVYAVECKVSNDSVSIIVWRAIQRSRVVYELLVKCRSVAQT